MRKIKIKFLDFWSGFDYNTFIIYKLLVRSYNVIIAEDPDYIVFSMFGHEHLNYPKAIKIYYTGENVVPDFNLCDYAIGYEYLEYGDRYLRFPDYYGDTYKDDMLRCEEKHIDSVKVINDKSEFCSFVYSNRQAAEIRDRLLIEISKYKKVNSGGRHLNNIGCPNGVEDKLEFQYKHKFAIACENSSHSGYTTEKLVQAFAARTIPIYWGDPKVKKVFNEKAFICVSDYPTIDALVEEIRRIDEDNLEYCRMLAEPALVDKAYALDNMRRDLELFLLSIFEQSKNDAYRRNMEFYGWKYQTNMKFKEEFVDKYIKLVDSRPAKALFWLHKKLKKL